ncbi:dTMP kinase [Clostridium sp. DL1XJH146]
MKGKLIILEATDGAGKKTQSDLLYKRLLKDNKKVMKVEYPNYDSPSSTLVKMYLAGDFGNKPEDVNAFAASAFYAVDRYASYKLQWKSFYEDGGIILADRYTTANMVHQASKIKDNNEKDSFLNWLWEFEFTNMGLPVPDLVLFLNMPPEYSQKLMKNRKNKITGKDSKDIHERDEEYLKNSYYNACYVAEKYNWATINCVKEDNIRTIEEIQKDVYSKVISTI